MSAASRNTEASRMQQPGRYAIGPYAQGHQEGGVGSRSRSVSQFAGLAMM